MVGFFRCCLLGLDGSPQQEGHTLDTRLFSSPMSLHLTGLGASHLVPPALRLGALHPGLAHLGSRRVESNRQMRGEKRRPNIVVKKEGQHGARERTGRLKPNRSTAVQRTCNPRVFNADTSC